MHGGPGGSPIPASEPTAWRRGFFAGVRWTVGGATSVSVPAGFNELFVVECERRA